MYSIEDTIFGIGIMSLVTFICYLITKMTPWCRRRYRISVLKDQIDVYQNMYSASIKSHQKYVDQETNATDEIDRSIASSNAFASSMTMVLTDKKIDKLKQILKDDKFD